MNKNIYKNSDSATLYWSKTEDLNRGGRPLGRWKDRVSKYMREGMREGKVLNRQRGNVWIGEKWRLFYHGHPLQKSFWREWGISDNSQIEWPSPNPSNTGTLTHSCGWRRLCEAAGGNVSRSVPAVLGHLLTLPPLLPRYDTPAGTWWRVKKIHFVSTYLQFPQSRSETYCMCGGWTMPSKCLVSEFTKERNESRRDAAQPYSGIIIISFNSVGEYVNIF